MRDVRIGALMLGPAAPGSTAEDQVDQVERLVGEAAAQGAQVVVVPEYAVCRHTHGPRHAVIPEPRAAFFAGLRQRYAELAKRHHVWLVGWIHEAADGGCYNSLVVYRADGHVAGIGRKCQLAPGERVSPLGVLAADGPTIIDSPFGRLGLAVCYDSFFPEHFRALALNGADIFLLATMADGRRREINDAVLKARAVDNARPIVQACNDCSRMGCVSQIVDAYGRVLAAHDPPGTDGVVVATVPLGGAVSGKDIPGQHLVEDLRSEYDEMILSRPYVRYERELAPRDGREDAVATGDALAAAV